MSANKLYTDKRWTDIPKCEVVGHREITEDEKREAEELLEKILEKEDEYFKKHNRND